jgi:uncharacterized protein YbaR (Trm112 family)
MEPVASFLRAQLNSKFDADPDIESTGRPCWYGTGQIETKWSATASACPYCRGRMARPLTRPFGRVVRLLNDDRKPHAAVDPLPDDLDAIYCPTCKAWFYPPKE